MVLRAALARLAAGGPAPVYAVAGRGGRIAVQDLRLQDSVRLVESPRAASVLLLAGAFPDESAEALARVHDTLSHPRATVWWPLDAPSSEAVTQFPHLVRVEDDVAATIALVYRALLQGARRTQAHLLPDEDPVPWRGEGPFGQGGSGMTGGTPYGRPMAGLGDDRDGLRLDILPVTFGPFTSALPSGLILEVTMSGDVVMDSAIPRNLLAAAVPGPIRPDLEPFARALVEPVPIAELELGRARAHLRWVADACVAHGLPALGLRVLRLATRLHPGDTLEVQRLARRLRWTQVFRWSTSGVGRIPGQRLAALGTGPVARASGLREDARLEDPAYQALAFEPIVHEAGDATARWEQRLEEVVQSLELAERAGERLTEVIGSTESPRGRLELTSAPSARLLEFIPSLIEGLEWGDAVTTLVSLDLDLDEAVPVATDMPVAAGG